MKGAGKVGNIMFFEGRFLPINCYYTLSIETNEILTLSDPSSKGLLGTVVYDMDTGITGVTNINTEQRVTFNTSGFDLSLKYFG